MMALLVASAGDLQSFRPLMAQVDFIDWTLV